jgi:hypothetical protein
MLTKVYVINISHRDIEVWDDFIAINDEVIIEGGFGFDYTGETIFGEDNIDSGFFIEENEIKRRIFEFPANPPEDVSYYSALYYGMQDVDINLHGAPYKVVEIEIYPEEWIEEDLM